MTIHPTLRRAAANIAALGLAALLLAGCVITSDANLIAPGEAATPLPSSFEMTTYSYAEDKYAKGEDEPASYTLNGASYVDSEESIEAMFVALGGADYLLAIAADESTMYGVARIEGGIMEIRMLLAGDPADDLPNPPAGVDVTDGTITVADRVGLDAAIALVRDGTIATEALLAWVGPGDAPATIVAENGWYRAE